MECSEGGEARAHVSVRAAETGKEIAEAGAPMASPPAVDVYAAARSSDPGQPGASSEQGVSSNGHASGANGRENSRPSASQEDRDRSLSRERSAGGEAGRTGSSRRRSPSRDRRDRRERERSSDRRGRRERSRDRRDRRDRSWDRRGGSRRDRSRDRYSRRRSRSRDGGGYSRRDDRRRRSPRRSWSPPRHRSRSRSPRIERAPEFAVERVLPPQAQAPAALADPWATPALTGGSAALAARAAKGATTALNQATRPSRRLYVGGLPTPCYDFQLQAFLNQALVAAGICAAVGGRMPIANCQVTPERGFAFVEFYEVADCTAAVQLDGLPYLGATLKVKRPKEYLPTPSTLPDPPPMGAAVFASFLAAQQGGGAPAVVPGVVAAADLPRGGDMRGGLGLGELGAGEPAAGQPPLPSWP